MAVSGGFGSMNTVNEYGYGRFWYMITGHVVFGQ
jgi:hypothetical protein